VSKKTSTVPHSADGQVPSNSLAFDLPARSQRCPEPNTLSLSLYFFLQATVAGLIAPTWTFDELRSKSDLIVIAERVATRDVGTKTEFTNLRPPFPVVELNTDFKVTIGVKRHASGRDSRAASLPTRDRPTSWPSP
jgi:hypothetical protein